MTSNLQSEQGSMIGIVLLSTDGQRLVTIEAKESEKQPQHGIREETERERVCIMFCFGRGVLDE